MTAVNTEPKSDVTADAERTHEERFKWRTWVHYPQGASQCENATNGKCRDADHFHAVCRLPNPFQQQDIVEKASAARARRLRMLRDPESDASIILEDQLQGLRDADKSILVEELVDRTFAEDYIEAAREVERRMDDSYVPEGDEEIPRIYADIDQDREEYMRRKDLPEDERGDDFEELEKQLGRYGEDVTEQLKLIQQPRLDHFNSLDMEALIDIVRRERIQQQGTDAYLQEYNAWQMYVGTVKPVEKGVPGQRVWADIQDMRNEDGDLILLVKEAFDQMDAERVRGRAGKD